MKRFSQLAMLLVLAACLSNCDKEDPQPYIPDNNFLEALIEAGVDTDGDGTISLEEASAVTSLILARKEISDLTGISKFVNLEELLCQGNDLTTLDVSNNTALERLHCDDNQLTNLDISKCTSLSQLNCSFNKLVNLDVTNNITLKWLLCFNNQLFKLNVSKNTALLSLYCGNNHIINLDVSKNIALTSLECSGNQLANLDVSNNTALVALHCSSNQLSNLDISKNFDLLLSHQSYNLNGLELKDMPSLYKVCVGMMPFPPVNAVEECFTEGSPNVYFTTECE